MNNKKRKTLNTRVRFKQRGHILNLKTTEIYDSIVKVNSFSILFYLLIPGFIMFLTFLTFLFLIGV